MFTSMMILKEKPENYDFYKELVDLRLQDKNCLHEIEELKNQISTYNDISAENEEKLLADKDKQSKELEHLKKVVSISELFSDFTKEGVERELKKWM